MKIYGIFVWQLVKAMHQFKQKSGVAWLLGCPLPCQAKVPASFRFPYVTVGLSVSWLQLKQKTALPAR